jgi:hypothetical protein
MSQSFEKAAEQAVAFQKIWLESTSRLLQAAFTFTPGSPPPEVMRQIRSGIFQALGESWEQFMRSPEFLEGMKGWLDNAVTFRKTSNEFMAKLRNELQAPSREDIDAIMLTVRHMEKRLLDRIDTLSEQVTELKQQLASGGAPRTGARPTATRRKTVKAAAATARSSGNGKGINP